jgi:hypothetical protein
MIASYFNNTFFFSKACQPKKIAKQMKVFFKCDTCKSPRRLNPQHPDVWISHRIKYLLMTQEIRNNLVLEEIRKHQKKGDKLVTSPNLFGIPMCWNCFAIIHGMSLSTVKRLGYESEAKWRHFGQEQSFHVAHVKKSVVNFIQTLQDNLGNSTAVKFSTFMIFV